MTRSSSHLTAGAALLFVAVATLLPSAWANQRVARTDDWPASTATRPPTFDHHRSMTQGGLVPTLPVAMYALDPILLAQFDRSPSGARNFVRYEKARYRPESLMDVDDAADASNAGERRGLPLPRPDRWTSLFATAALGLFFFVRRAL